jgi:RND family efflux transporter MFP subunit
MKPLTMYLGAVGCVVACILTAVAVTTVSGCNKAAGETAAATEKKPSKQAPEIAVTTAPVTTRPIQRSVEVVGTFYGREEVVISPKVTGRVKRLYFDMGDAVKPGDLLLEIDDTDLMLAVQEAEKSLESELAKLGMRDLSETEGDLTKLPNIERARLLAENAAQKLRRIEPLVRQNISTKEEYEQLLTDQNVATSEYHQALMEARATVAAARQKAALLTTARQHLADTKLFAPTPTQVGSQPTPGETYFVTERMVTEGEMVEAAPSTPVFRLVIDDPLKLRVSAPEREVSQIKLGQPVEVAAEAYANRKFAGKVSRISPAVDLASRTFEVEILVPNRVHELKAGNFGKANILTHEDRSAIIVPAEAIISFAGVTKVFVVQNGKAQGVEIRLGIRGDNWCEVTGAVQPGMEVVTSGYTKLADGTPVRVRTSDVAPTPDTTTASTSPSPASAPPPRREARVSER